MGVNEGMMAAGPPDLGVQIRNVRGGVSRRVIARHCAARRMSISCWTGVCGVVWLIRRTIDVGHTSHQKSITNVIPLNSQGHHT